MKRFSTISTMAIVIASLFISTITFGQTINGVSFSGEVGNTYCDTTGGYCNGSAVVTVSGSESAWSYKWGSGGVHTLNMNPGASATLTGLCPGINSITVMDVTEAVISVTSVSISDAAVHITVTSTGTDPTCGGGGTDGTATATATGGTSTLSYTWSPSMQNSATATGLSGGSPEICTVSDMLGCLATTTVTLNMVPGSLDLALTITDVSTCGGSDGTVEAFVTGGTTYTYLWSNGGTNSQITNVIAGSYTVTVAEAGCTVTESGTVGVGAAGGLSLTMGTVAETCAASDGTGTATPGGGSSPYSYLWDIGQTTQTATGLSTTSYMVTVTDANGCFDTGSVTVGNALGSVTVSASSTDASCLGGDGTASAVAGGGVGPYSYTWDNAFLDASISGLAAGTYFVTAMDNNGCEGLTSVTISNASGSFTTTATSTDQNCSSLDGTATVVASGGVTPYAYLWSSLGTAEVETGLTSGFYYVSVTDNAGCMSVASISVSTNAAVVTSNVTTTDASCGLSNGIALVNGSGGTAPYSYSWDDASAQSTAQAAGLSAGSYSVDITDANGCTGIVAVSISSSSIGSITTSSIDATCSAADGSATAAVTGGSSPFTYNWSNGQSTAVATGVTAGIHSITVTDGNGCELMSSVTVNSTASTVTVSVVCTATTGIGASDGSSIATASGGNSNYSYAWNNGVNTATNTTLSAGTVYVTVTDGNGCEATDNCSITDPGCGGISFSASSTDISCNGLANGSAIGTMSGSQGPVTYAWSSSLNTTNQETGLSAGNYSVTATDSIGCVASLAFTVLEPAALAVSESSNAPTCNASADGSINLNVTGGTSTYTFIWDNGSNLQNISGLISNTYIATITDANSCSITQSVSIAAPANLNASVITTQETCSAADGSVSATASGGTSGYSFLWSNGATTANANGLMAGSYFITIVDANGCEVSTSGIVTSSNLSFNLTLTPTNSTCGSSDGVVDATSSGGSSPYTYAWSNGGNGTAITNVASGSYEVTVTDNNGCVSTGASVVVDAGGPVVTLLGVLPETCASMSDGSAAVAVSGGLTPYSFLWSNSDTSQNLDSVTAGNYALVVTDDNGCNGGVSATILNSGGDLPTITGNVGTLIGGGITAGVVTIFMDNGIGAYPEVGTANIDGAGNYSVSNLPIGNYIVMASPDLGAHPWTIPAYSDSATFWTDANVLVGGCATDFIANITVPDLNPLNGSAVLSGLVTTDGTGKAAVGDPIPGIDVQLEKIPGGIVANDVTDLFGAFSFENVPEGNYEVLVNFPGMDLVSSYEVSVGDVDTAITDLNYLVSDSTVYVNAVSAVSTLLYTDFKCEIYPNPTDGEINLFLTMNADEQIFFFIHSIDGKRIYNETLNLSKGEQQVKRTNIGAYGNGIYFVTVRTAAHVEVVKIVVNK